MKTILLIAMLLFSSCATQNLPYIHRKSYYQGCAEGMFMSAFHWNKMRLSKDTTFYVCKKVLEHSKKMDIQDQEFPEWFSRKHVK